jgi:hypothetical protein
MEELRLRPQPQDTSGIQTPTTPKIRVYSARGIDIFDKATAGSSISHNGSDFGALAAGGERVC